MINQNRLYINYGKDYAEMTYNLMREAGVGKTLEPDMKIILKPNLVVAKEARFGATTHPEVIDGIIKYLIENGITNITIAEGSWIGVPKTESAFRECGYFDLLNKYRKYNISLLDTKKDKVIFAEAEGEKLGVCKTIYEADYLINIPVLKGHCQTKMTCCLKNMKGYIPDSEKRRYHSVGLTKPIALLNSIIKPNLHIVDSICGDLDFEEGGNPVQADRIMLGFDPVLLDSYGASLLGYTEDDVGYLKLANELGLGEIINKNTIITELNANSKPAHQNSNGTASRLAKNIDEKSACSACYANLIFALDKTDTNNLNQKVKIGQGWRGVKDNGIGVGNCTRGCAKNIKGCPPAAVDIIEFLKNLD